MSDEFKADLRLAYMLRLEIALNATIDMAEIGATGSTTNDGPSPYHTVSGLSPMGEPLPTPYRNIQNWMFGDTDTTTKVQRKSMPWRSLPLGPSRRSPNSMARSCAVSHES